MAPIFLVLGFVLFALGIGYTFRPQLIIRFNAFMRETFFKDAVVFLNNRRIGAWLLLISVFFLVLSLNARP